MQNVDPRVWRADALLDTVPIANEAVQEVRDKGSLVLRVPIRQRWFNRGLFAIVLPYRQNKGYALDQIGEEVWRACDGKRTMEDLIDTFARRHQLRFHEARVAVTQFVQQMVQRGLLVLAVPDAILETLKKEQGAA